MNYHDYAIVLVPGSPEVEQAFRQLAEWKKQREKEQMEAFMRFLFDDGHDGGVPGDQRGSTGQV